MYITRKISDDWLFAETLLTEQNKNMKVLRRESAAQCHKSAELLF